MDKRREKVERRKMHGGGGRGVHNNGKERGTYEYPTVHRRLASILKSATNKTFYNIANTHREREGERVREREREIENKMKKKEHTMSGRKRWDIQNTSPPWIKETFLLAFRDGSKGGNRNWKKGQRRTKYKKNKNITKWKCTLQKKWADIAQIAHTYVPKGSVSMCPYVHNVGQQWNYMLRKSFQKNEKKTRKNEKKY